MNSLLASILVIFLVPAALATSVSVESCLENSKLRIDELRIWPLPIQYPSELHGQLRGAVLQPVTGNFKIEIKLYAKVSFGFFSKWLKFPMCIGDNFGSCTIEDGCAFFSSTCELDWCRCPLEPRNIDITFRDIRVPSLPRLLQWAAERDYLFEVRTFEDGHVTTCNKVLLHLDDE